MTECEQEQIMQMAAVTGHATTTGLLVRNFVDSRLPLSFLSPHFKALIMPALPLCISSTSYSVEPDSFQGFN